MIKKVAGLANLELTSEEEEQYQTQLSKVLDYIKQLDEIDISGVEPTYNVTSNKNITREDELGTSLTQHEAINNSTALDGGYFTAKGVFEDE